MQTIKVRNLTSPTLNSTHVNSTKLCNGTCVQKTDDIFIAKYIQNTSVFKEMLKYRSKDAVWGALCITFLLVLLILAALYSKMWRTRDAGSWLEETPDLDAPQSRVSVKDILRSKAKYLPQFKKKFSRKKKGYNYRKIKSSSDDDSDYTV